MTLHSCYGNLCKITRQDIKYIPQAVYSHISAMEKPLRVFLYLGTLRKGLQGKMGKFVKVLILELNHKQLFYMEDGIQLFSVSQLACVASVSNRVITRKLERKQKKGWLRSPPPPPSLIFFLLLSQLSRRTSWGNACYAGYESVNYHRWPNKCPGHLFNGLSSFPNVLGLALHQFAYTMKEKITTLQWARSLEETEVRV